jgi:phenol hydroxylase P0 protein
MYKSNRSRNMELIKKDSADGEAGQMSELKRYARIRRVVDDKFIEFDFAIGDPSLYVELVLPKDAFDTFCRHNKVVMMTDEEAQAVDADMAKWRYGDEATES